MGGRFRDELSDHRRGTRKRLHPGRGRAPAPFGVDQGGGGRGASEAIVGAAGRRAGAGDESSAPAGAGGRPLLLTSKDRTTMCGICACVNVRCVACDRCGYHADGCDVTAALIKSTRLAIVPSVHMDERRLALLDRYAAT